MAFNSLVTGECGGSNALMKLTEQVHNHSLSERNIHYKPESRHNGIQQSFDMQTLLNEMQDIQRPIVMPNLQHVENSAKNWEQEFLRDKHHSRVKAQHKPINAVQLKDTNLYLNNMHQHQHHPMYQPVYHPPPPLQHAQMANQSNWAHDFLDDSLKALHINRDEPRTAKEIIESFEDEDELSKQWVDEFEKEEIEEDKDDYLNSIPDVTDADVEYWEKLQKDFNEMFKDESVLNGEERMINSPTKEEEYRFEESNPFTGLCNSFEEGVKKLDEGDLISAILLFEEAVTQQPDHAEAWQYLGTSQAENEQEMLSIKALKKCLEIQPDNLEAWLALSVSFTNESMYLEACDSLKSWIKNNPRYNHLPNISNGLSATSRSSWSSIVSTETLKEVENIFLAAARIAPQQGVDPDIQIGLGVLFNISHEYDKAIDCFQTGLQVKPDSALLWNKLGATLANSGRSAEAVEAYRNALSLRPGFIRCRYNLGISCINLKVYTTAIEHFLTALNMQRQGEDPLRTASTMSENIWDTLRMTLSLSGRHDLLKAVEKRDLQLINRELNDTPL